MNRSAWVLRYTSPLLWVMCSSLAGCSADTQKEADKLKSEVESLRASNQNLQKEIDRLKADEMRAGGQLKDREAQLVGFRMGITRPDEVVEAALETSMGRIVLKLDWRGAPYTVQNFVTLAEGTREWIDPATQHGVKRPFYNGLTFHRVVPGFMIQGGDPLANGRGGPGYTFPDEINPSIKFDKPGLLAMANSGPDTNGSQFFITDGPAPNIDGKHTIFGEVIGGQEVVHAIAAVKRDKDDKPLTPVVIKQVKIIREVPPEATAAKDEAH